MRGICALSIGRSFDGRCSDRIVSDHGIVRAFRSSYLWYSWVGVMLNVPIAAKNGLGP